MPFDLSAYEPVEHRLRAFWEEHPDGRIETDLIHAQDGTYIVKAWTYRDLRDPHASASGLATESVTDRGVNATSALENCETSAIGRALANLGYAAKGKRPSREEMAKSAPVTAGDQGAAGPGEGAKPSPGHQALPGGTTAALGEGATDPPGKGLFPLRPEDCDHKTKTGRWLPTRIIDGQARCPRCGLSAVIYRESAA